MDARSEEVLRVLYGVAAVSIVFRKKKAGRESVVSRKIQFGDSMNFSTVSVSRVCNEYSLHVINIPYKHD